MKIALLFNKQRLDTWGIYIEKALRKTQHEITHFQSSDVKHITNEFDLYFKIDDGDYTYDFPENLKPKVYYMSDTHLHKPLQKMKKQAKNYDIVFMALRESVCIFKELGIKSYWVNAACDPEVHVKLNLPKIYDIGFVGTTGGIPRQFYLQALRERYPISFISEAPHTEMGRIYSQSRIGFNYPIGHMGFTMRSCEILSSGTFLLMKSIGGETLSHLRLVDKEQLRMFHSTEELFELINYYLKHESEREKIAQQGYNLIRKYHTYDHRVQEILSIIKKDLGLS